MQQLLHVRSLVAGERLIHLSHRISAVVADCGGGLVDLFAAFVAEPFKVIDLARFALAFEDNEPGVRFQPR